MCRFCSPEVELKEGKACEEAIPKRHTKEGLQVPLCALGVFSVCRI